MLFFLMFIITLVASFSIGSTLFSAVIRRSREVGVLASLYAGVDLRPLGSDPRWGALLGRLGMTRAQLDAIPLEVKLPDGTVLRAGRVADLVMLVRALRS